MKKLPTKLYNVILPIWLLMLFPQMWLLVIPGNLAIDCAVLLITLAVLKHSEKKAVLKALWWKFWLLGFAADFVGVALLLPAVFIPEWLGGTAAQWWSQHLTPVLHNPFQTLPAFLWTAAAVALAGFCIYRFDRRAMGSCAMLSDRDRHIIALAMAFATAPWTFFIPVY